MNGGSWNRPTVMQRQPTTWESFTRPLLANLLTTAAVMKMQQRYQTKQAEAATKKATAAEESRRQFETTLKGAKYDAEKGTVTFPSFKLTEDQKKRFDVIQPSAGPAQLMKRPVPKTPTFFTGATGEVTPVTTTTEGPTAGPSLGIIGKPSPKPTGLTLPQQKELETHKAGLKVKKVSLKQARNKAGAFTWHIVDETGKEWMDTGMEARTGELTLAQMEYATILADDMDLPNEVQDQLKKMYQQKLKGKMGGEIIEFDAQGRRVK